MIYSIVVWGLTPIMTIKAKNMSDGRAGLLHELIFEELKENRYIVRYFDHEIHEECHYSCKADSEFNAKITFRLSKDFADTKRYTIISVKKE